MTPPGICSRSIPRSVKSATFTYDKGQVHTVSDQDNYTITYDAIDRVTNISYPDGTSEEAIYERLDAMWTKDVLYAVEHRSQ